jgi:D-3-phosphoglycerate dehydrogenase
MQVGTADSQQRAMAVISVTEPVGADILQQLHDVPPVQQVTQINL